MVRTLKEYAIKNDIPIIEDDSLAYLLEYIKTNQIKDILEIGTAIGYSAINMALINKDISITTVERNTDMYNQAIENIKVHKLENQIKVIYADALEVKIADKFDLIFIDAAKSQYKRFFTKFENNLKESGTIISDNVNFHGFVNSKVRINSRNLRQLVGKIEKYQLFLKENKEYKTTFINVGDGLSISVKE